MCIGLFVLRSSGTFVNSNDLAGCIKSEFLNQLHNHQLVNERCVMEVHIYFMRTRIFSSHSKIKKN